MELALENDNIPGFVVFDTETTGLFRYDLPADAPGQPRLAELSLIETNRDFSVIDEKHFFIRPDGWVMPPEAGRINGLTTERLLRDGVPLAEAISAFNEMLDRKLIAAGFNVAYDLKVMRGELRRAGHPDRFLTTPSLCAMKKCIGVCKIPKARGNGYKTPKLREALQHFKIQQRAEHTSPGDALNTVEIFKMLKRIGIPLLPEMPKSKDKPQDE